MRHRLHHVSRRMVLMGFLQLKNKAAADRPVCNKTVNLYLLSGTELFNTFPFDQARKVFEEVALADEFVDFLTLPAYKIID